VVRLSDRVEIADLSSTNHTFVNETALAGWRVLSPSDSFRLGAVEGTYEIGTGSGADRFASVPTSAIDATVGAGPVSDLLIGAVDYPGLIADPGSHTPLPAPTAAGDGANAVRGSKGSYDGWSDAGPAAIGGGRRGAPAVRGIARGIQLRSESGQRGFKQVLDFRVENFDTTGDRRILAAVELKASSLSGVIYDGDEVEVWGRWQDNVLRASRVRDLTTHGTTGPSRWVNWMKVAIVFAVIVFLSLAGLIAMLAIHGTQQANKDQQQFCAQVRRDFPQGNTLGC
jgi:hypothetical protein